jgi:hypothetical protein
MAKLPAKHQVLTGDDEEDVFSAVAKPRPKFNPSGGSDHYNKFRVKSDKDVVAAFVDDDDNFSAPAIKKATRVPKSLFEDD